MANEKYTDITLIVDASGSMSELTETTIKGVNDYIQAQIDSDSETRISLVTFADRARYHYTAVEARFCPKMDRSNYYANGGTALWDTLGQVILEKIERLNSLSYDEQPGRKVVVILTDGEECTSKVWKLPDIKSLITTQEEKYGWDFIYLGSAADAVLIAKGMGIQAGKAAKFTPKHDETQSVFNTLAANTRALRSGQLGAAGASVTSFFDEGQRLEMDEDLRKK